VTSMRLLALAVCMISIASSNVPARAIAQPNMLTPMSVKNYKVLLQVSRNGGWGATAYRNYLVGLFEGLMSSEGDAAGDRYGRLFCLPPERASGSLTEKFEWLENELNNVVAKSSPDAYVARIFVTHLTTSYPCKG
jgi:hypothetical protein